MVGVKVAWGLVGVVDGNGEIAVWGGGVVYLQVLELGRNGGRRVGEGYGEKVKATGVESVS